jgi:hypothetical protein
MTVAELIEELKKYPPDCEVYLYEDKDHDICTRADVVQLCKAKCSLCKLHEGVLIY